MRIHGRSEWEQPGAEVTGPANYPGLVQWIVVHYPGYELDFDRDRDGDFDETDTKLLIQQWQRNSLSSRGYSLYYQHVIGRQGDIWEVRGFDIRNAANGPTDHPETFGPNANTMTHSVKFVSGLDGEITAAQWGSMRWLVGHIRTWYGRHLDVIGHRDVKSTTCPGDPTYRMIRAGAFEPPTMPPPAPTPTEGPDMIVLDYQPSSARFVRMCWTGVELAWTFDGNAAAVLDRAKVPIVVVSKVELLGIIRSSRRTTTSPWGPKGYSEGTPGHDGELHDAWMAP